MHVMFKGYLNVVIIKYIDKITIMICIICLVNIEFLNTRYECLFLRNDRIDMSKKDPKDYKAYVSKTIINQDLALLFG